MQCFSYDWGTEKSGFFKKPGFLYVLTPKLSTPNILLLNYGNSIANAL
jgi:hypothetical protein